MGVMGSLSPPTSSITSASNLHLTLSFSDSPQTSTLEKKLQETFSSSRNSTMAVMGSLSPPSSSITSASSTNLDLTLSLIDSSQTSTLDKKLQETRDGDKKTIRLFGFTIAVDHIKQKPMPGIKNNVGGIVKGRYVKALTKSDVGSCCRFMLKKQFVKENVIPFMNDAQRENVRSNGYHVRVYDCDTKTEHDLKFKLWTSSNTYVFTEWSQQFVKRRNLQTGDRVSLFWKASKFYFSVLQRAKKNNN